jgi:ATP-binding cassette subfamily F protein 3
MLQVANLTKAFGSRILFENLSFALGKGDITGFVGRNGCGKSTLMRIIMGKESHDGGVISTPSGYKMGYLDQHISFSKSELLQEAITALPKEHEFEHYRAEKILFGLGFTDEDMTKNPKDFSGGFQLRIQLAKCLLSNPDLLLLDEPTNYLDVLSLRWMRGFLKSFQGEVVIITHDRDFMDSVVTHTMGLHRQKLKKVQGDTEKYYTQLQEEEEIYEKTRANRDKKIQQMQRFVDRFKAKASKATQAQSVMKKIEKMGAMAQLDDEQVMGFRFHYSPTPAKRLLEVKNLSFGFSEQDILFSNLSFELKPEDRIAIVGKNGKGKTTLLNVLAGDLKAHTGEIVFHPNVNLGYYQQTNRKNLNPTLSIYQEIAQSNGDLDITQIRGICGAMMFSGIDADKKIKVLSGGEQSRVLLGKVIAHKNNVLFLDEPTNHLDMESIEIMTEEIDQFEGGVLFVTHDEQMLRRLATRLIIFHEGKAELFNGGYDEFLEKIGWQEESSGKKKAGKVDRKEQKRLRAELVNERAAKMKPLKEQLTKTEAAIQILETKMGELNGKVMELVADPSRSSEIQGVYKEIGQIQIKLEAEYQTLFQVTEKADAINADYNPQIEALKD